MRFLTILLLLCSFSVLAQTDVKEDTLFFDDFNNSDDNWSLPTSETNFAVLGGGHANWTHTSDNNSFTWRGFQSLNFNKDFIIKVKFQYKSGDGKYGIV